MSKITIYIKNIFEKKVNRFLFVGVLNTLVGYGIFGILIYTGTNYFIANTISYIVGIIHSYIWNKFFTFKTPKKNYKEIFKFILVYLISYIIGLCLLYILIDKLYISEYIAGAINIVITIFISWFGHSKFSFK